MLQKIKKMMKGICSSERIKMLSLMLLVGTVTAFAQNAAGDYSAGTTALGTVTDEIAKYVPYVVKLCYAIAGIVAVVGAISVYIKMNNEEQDVKKSIMMIVGACIFLVPRHRHFRCSLVSPLDSAWEPERTTAATRDTHCSRGFNGLLN